MAASLGVLLAVGVGLVLGVLLADHPVGPVEHVVAVLLGHAEEVGDHDCRGSSAEMSVTKSACALLDDGVDDVVGRLVDLLLELVDHPRREALVDQPPVAGVQRRVHVEHHQPLLLELARRASPR